MSGETVVTIVGNLVGDPSCGAPLRESRSRIPLRRTSRGFLDRASGTWKDGDAVLLRARSVASPCRECRGNPARRGDASRIFCGRLRKRTSGIAAGAQRTEVEVEEIGLSQRYATAAVSYVARATRSSTPAGSISRRTSRRPDPRLGAQPAPGYWCPTAGALRNGAAIVRRARGAVRGAGAGRSRGRAVERRPCPRDGARGWGFRWSGRAGRVGRPLPRGPGWRSAGRRFPGCRRGSCRAAVRSSVPGSGGQAAAPARDAAAFSSALIRSQRSR